MKTTISELLLLFALLAITIGFLVDHRMSKDLKILTERIDSINNATKHNADSALYQMNSDFCPTCGRPFEHKK